MTGDGAPPRERWELPDLVGADDGIDRLWVVDGRLNADRPSGAEKLPGRVATSGLVDGHFHMALRYAGIALGMDDALEALRAARAVGVLLVRDMGAPERLSLKLPADPTLPHMISSGRQLAVEGGFIEGSYEPVPPGRLVEAALEEIDAGAAWVKVLTDWNHGDPPTYPMPVLREMVDAVHARGVRVAAHNSWAPREVVLAGVDSIEHGTLMDEDTLQLMAERGTAWAPTTNFGIRNLEEIAELLADPEAPPDRRERLERARHSLNEEQELAGRMVPMAARLGVPLLASTDSCGTVADEVVRWVGWGVPPDIAVGAAIWDARRYLGAEGLADGASADVVTFDADPREDPSALQRPVAIVLRGRRLV